MSHMACCVINKSDIYRTFVTVATLSQTIFVLQFICLRTPYPMQKLRYWLSRKLQDNDIGNFMVLLS